MNVHDRLDRIEASLQSLARLLTNQTDDVLTVEGVIELTNLSKSAIYQKTCSLDGRPPELPHFKQGKRLYFRRSEVMQWLTKNRIRNREQIEAEADTYSSQRAQRHS